MKVGIKYRSGSIALIFSLVLVFRNIKNTTSANCYYAVSPASNSRLSSSDNPSTMGKSYFHDKSSKRKQNNSNYEYGDHNKLEYKFDSLTEGKAQKTFAAIKEVAIGEINQSSSDLHDVVDTLRVMKIKDLSKHLPIREYSTNKNRDMAKTENHSLKFIFEEEIKEHVARRRNLEKGMQQAYLILFNDWCTTT